MKGKVPLKLPHCGLGTVKISAQLPWHQEPYHRCMDLTRKIIFLGCCGLLSWCICSYGNVIALAWVLQNSQQAILVADLLVVGQEILVMLTESQFPL